ncbi:MAG: hypothetical protein HY540_04790 [Deltaproteobacteria bacterium]|nr:hypothetical protein [Deltaproteobacteria bacterium]
MILETLYTMLKNLYGINDAPDAITPYLLALKPRHDGHQEISVGSRFSGMEAMLVKETNDDVQLGVYLHPLIRQRLQHGSLRYDDLGYAAEGLSHFLYVIDRAGRNKSCSQLELELQAEVDKFIVLHLLTIEAAGKSPHNIFTWQFDSPDFAADLSHEERDRYETANHFAAKFCWKLRERCFFPLRRSELLAWIRPFFEANLEGKLARLIP